MEKWDLAEKNILKVVICGHTYCLPVAAVESVVSLRPGAVCPVPFDTGGRVRGLFNNKGTAVALLHCPGLMPECEHENSGELIAVILKNGEKRFALPVDSADTVPAEEGMLCLSVEKLYRGEPGYGD